MDNSIFRKKSLKKIQSPDNLNEYIKVVNPSLWIVFIAAFLILAGAFVWGTVGRIEDKIMVTAIANNGNVTCEYNESIKVGMKAVINGFEGSVKAISPSVASLEFDNMPDGIYSCYITLGEISPISFVFN